MPLRAMSTNPVSAVATLIGRGPPTFSKRTCLATLTSSGTYRIIGGTARYRHVRGHAGYQLTAYAIVAEVDGTRRTKVVPYARETLLTASGPIRQQAKRRHRPPVAIAALFQGLDGESQLAEYSYGAGFAAFEVTGGQGLPGSEFVGGAQDGLVGVAAFVPDQLVAAARAVAMLGEELLGAQPVVVLKCCQHVIAAHVIPGHHVCTFLR
ncbi:MAG TPA: hypothetical protein VME44_11595 [Streptosporangiaceae bacterium]|nr:hypothetical protein [Streptosporangiaceae bacterium]